MSNVVGMNEFVGMANGDLHCWLCQKPVSTRALFCHHCGTIQMVREIDHFARLGLERRIDIDIELMDKQFESFSRTLDPQRFLIRGMGERGHAAKQMEALQEAYDTLRDPLRRGRYWLQLNAQIFDAVTPSTVIVDALRSEMRDAVDPGKCDRVAQKAGQALEQGIIALMQALRSQDWTQANETLAELYNLEAILDEVRGTRTRYAPSGDGKGTPEEVLMN